MKLDLIKLYYPLKLKYIFFKIFKINSMEIDTRLIKRKVGYFLRSKFNLQTLINYSKRNVTVFEIYLEDINAFDKELYLFLLKKPDKFIWLSELILKILIEKIDKKKNNDYDQNDFQIILLRKTFYSIPNNVEKIGERTFVSLKAIVSSIGDLKLKNKQQVSQIYSFENENNIEAYSDIGKKLRKHVKSLRFEKSGEVCSFTDYQITLATSFIGLDLKAQKVVNLTLILEKNLVGKLFPGEEIFFSGILMKNRTISENWKRMSNSKSKIKNFIIKVLGFSKLNFLNKFNLNDGNGNLDKKFIEFAQSRNIYKWIYSLIIPAFKTSFSFKQALSCLLFGGNKKILADNFILNGQINILVLDQEQLLFSNLENYFKNLISLSYDENEKSENYINNGNRSNKERSLERISFSKISQLFYDFKVILIEKFENLNFNEHCLVSNVLDTKFFFKHNQLLNQVFPPLSIIAFYDDLIKKNCNKIKNPIPASFILAENLKKFDLIAVSSEISEETVKNSNFNINNYVNYFSSIHFDQNTVKLENTSFEFFKNYIGFVREKFTPKLSKKASEFIKNAYIFLKISKKRVIGKKISESYRIRKLETIIKISEAIGKMRMAKEVDSTDALEAVRLVQIFTI